MIVVDVESTGTDAKLCSLLSVGAVEFENPSNSFYVECYAFAGAHIEKEALEITGFTMEEITGNNQSPISNNQKEKSSAAEDGDTSFRKGGIRKVTDREVVIAFLEWMKTCKEWTLAGQNVSFDRDFLRETAHRYHIDWPLAQRTIDLHTLAYTEFLKTGRKVPRKNNHSALNLEAILQYVGVLITRENGHNALEDAKLEAEAFSRFFHGKNLFSEYALFPVPLQLQRQV